MVTDNRISILDFALAISDAIDLVAPALNNHHKKVANISCNIALAMELPNSEVQDIVLAAVLHDIGAFSVEERIELLEPDSHDVENNLHALMGYKLLKGFGPLSKAAELIRRHHEDYSKTGGSAPVGSHIIHLADRVAVRFDENREITGQVPEALEKINRKKSMFHPDVLAAFMRIAGHEYFLLEAFSPSLSMVSMKRIWFSHVIADLETLRGFAKVIAQIIDFRSRFTATHSNGVAAVAHELTRIAGFSDRECRLMEIAGFLHDVGKLAVPNSILEKNGSLDAEEFNTVKKHAYYTYAILAGIEGLEGIATWAASHHERQDGNGYPFHVRNEDFSKFARVMAVADILTALLEDRPYRAGMAREKAEEALLEMAKGGGIDGSIVDLAREHFFRINDVRIKAQQAAREEYEAFHAEIAG